MNRLFLLIKKHPMNAIEIVVAWFLVLQGLLVVSPFFQADVNSFSVSVSTISGKFIGLFLLLLGAVWSFALANRNKRYSLKTRAICSYITSVLFIFIGVSRGVVLGFGHPIWMNVVVVGVISGIIYLYLKWASKYE